MARLIPRDETIKYSDLEPPKGYRRITENEAYHYCKEFIPEVAGTYSGTLLICGGGKSFWDDYHRFQSISKDHDVMAVNIAGMFVPKVNHLFSLHFKQIAAINAFRKAEYPGCDAIVHSHRDWNGVDYVWYLALGASTSGFIAVVLGYILGYRKIVLAGVPMDGSGYFYKPMINPTFGDKHRQEEIVRLKQKYGQYVRSMSGNTKEMLGHPDTTFLRS